MSIVAARTTLFMIRSLVFGYFSGMVERCSSEFSCSVDTLLQELIWARELFYYLKGGRVDYGPEHRQVHAHTRFRRIYDTGIIRCGMSRTRCTLWGTRPTRRLRGCCIR